jgi:hypothetical protein
MRSEKSVLFLTALGIAFLVTPAFAQDPHRWGHTMPFQGPSIEEVVFDGGVIGAGPDPRIRSELLRDYPSRDGD